ncbi:MAG: defense against restriction DarA-related protein [Methylosarcina sp.]
MITWNNDLPKNTSLQQILYQCRRADGDNGLILDSVSMADILEEADEILLFDALVSTYARLERKMSALKSVMERAGGDVKPVAMPNQRPFQTKRRSASGSGL